MRVLCIAAHADDEVLGCGGTLARLAMEGHETYIAIFGEGITSRYKERDKADFSLVEQLQRRIGEVAQQLGAKEHFIHTLPDNRFDTVPTLDVVKLIEELVTRIKPQVIYTHHGGDLNVDHVVLHRATLTATRPMKGQCVKQVYAYEVASSTEWAFLQFAPAFHPNTFVDISDTLELKIQAMETYESEARLFPHPRSPDALRAIARRHGSVVGLGAAEVFQLIRSVQ